MGLPDSLAFLVHLKDEFDPFKRQRAACVDNMTGTENLREVKAVLMFNIQKWSFLTHLRVRDL